MSNMMNFSSLLAANGMSFSERASEALTMVIMGMVMIFLVLAIIMAVLMIMERVFARKNETGESKKVEVPKKSAPVVAPAPAVVTAEDDGAIIAAITAAISAMLAESGDETYQGGFRVVSFKRSNRNTPWNSAR